ncbi:MAG TPA: FkbM family methyltransferase [Bacteroidia bacterium]|nr:FkbM family methyltransferase [Bacteroidia bacterium]
MRQFIKGILLVIAPDFIKKRVFAHYQTLNWKTLSTLEFDAELLLLEFLLTKDSVFFDIGTNKGEYAYYAEKLINPKNIYLFEPEKKLNKQLRAIFSNCQIFDLALSDNKGTHQFKIPLINGVADNCLSSLEVKNKEDNETEAIIYEVKTDTLDNFIAEKNIHPDLIKIDVEGHELSVLKGAESFINKHHPTLIIEIEQRHHKDINIESVFESFKQKGYNCYYYSKKQSQLFPYNNKTHLTNSKEYFGKIDYINNYIFIHESNKTIQPVELINASIFKKVK